MPKNISLAIPRLLKYESMLLLKNANFSLEIKPLVQIDYLDVTLDVDSLQNTVFIFTSIHALYALEKWLMKNPHLLNTIQAFCIQGRTSDYAKKKGINVLGMAPNGKNLADVIRQKTNFKEKKYIHLSSNIRLDEWKLPLLSQNYKIVTQEVYRKTINSYKYDTFDGALFFSPSQGEAFLKENTLDQKDIFCIGTTTANFFKSKNFKNIVVSTEASELALVQTVIKHYNG